MNKRKACLWSIRLILFSVTVFFIPYLSSPPAEGAASAWTQTNWAGGATVNTASDPFNQTGWTEHSAKDANLGVSGNGEDLSLSPVNSWTDTTDSDFNTGTMNDIVIRGTGEGASVELDYISGFVGDGFDGILTVTAAGTVWRVSL